MTFSTFSAKMKPLVDRGLERFFAVQAALYGGTAFLAKDVLGRLKRFSMLGKSVRGCLVLLSASMFGCRKTSDALNAAMAVELIHSGFLVHDDIMDNDTVRRGSPTIFAQYLPLARKSGSRDPYMSAVSLGICAGDLAYFLSESLLLGTRLAPAPRDLLVRTFNEEITRVGLAQMDDVYWGFAKAEPTAGQIEKIYNHITSRYTFSLPLMMGAIIAGRKSPVLRQVGELGETIGLVFQLRDDAIGLLSTEAAIGKPVGSDVRENKKTLIRHHLFRRASPAGRRVLGSIFGRKDLKKSDLDRIRSVWDASDMDGLVDSVAGRCVEKADRIIGRLPVGAGHRGVLRDLVAWVSSRTR